MYTLKWCFHKRIEDKGQLHRIAMCTVSSSRAWVKLDLLGFLDDRLTTTTYTDLYKSYLARVAAYDKGGYSNAI